MKSWLFEEQEISSIEDMPSDIFGFVYEVIHEPTGKRYIGKKQLFLNQKKKLTKKELSEYSGSGRRPSFKIVQKENDWLTYYGSHSEIKKMIKEGKEDEFERKIIMFCKSKKELTYYECKYLFMEGAIEPGSRDDFFNEDILGKFHRQDFL